ncbi:MAG: 50S ribosomal protein L25 [Hydrogenoanaerobacterium sp.]
MYSLNAEKRNEQLKCKQLRKQGIIPVNVYGGDLKETLLFQISLIEANRMLKTKAKGSTVMLNLGDKKLSVLLKDVSYTPVSGMVETISFQKLMEDEIVHSTLRIVLLNKEKTTMMVQQLLEEIPYKALPADLIEKIEIDMDKIKEGSTIKIEDLPFAKNKKIEILIPLDTLVLNMVENFKNKVTEVADAPVEAK